MQSNFLQNHSGCQVTMYCKKLLHMPHPAQIKADNLDCAKVVAGSLTKHGIQAHRSTAACLELAVAMLLMRPPQGPGGKGVSMWSMLKPPLDGTRRSQQQ